MKILIDLEKECIPSIYANFKGVKRNVVSNWIDRGKIHVRHIEPLKLTLITIPQDERKDFIIFLNKLLKTIPETIPRS